MELADSAILPYNLDRFPKAMQDTLDDLDKNNVTKQLEDNGASLRFIKEAVKDFASVASEFQTQLKASRGPCPANSISLGA